MTTSVEYGDRRWDWPLHAKDGNITVAEDDRHFEVALEAPFFTNDDISVDVVGDVLEIHMEHVVDGNKDPVRRMINRAYKLPPGAEKDSIHSYLSDDVLHISGRKVQKSYLQ